MSIKTYLLKSRTRLFISLALIVFVISLHSCGGEESGGGEKGAGPSVNDYDENLDSNQSLNTTIKGIQFSVPSPIQTASLIKNSGLSFNKELINSADNAANYATNFHKALNLGIYGADLGYITINGQSDLAMSYITTVSRLSEELNVSGAFNESIINRFSDNLDKPDSILVLVGEAYRAGNNYLQTEERYDVIGLILAGGWLETMYFAATIAKEKKNQDVINRIGEQKASLEGLIALLEDYRNDDLMDDFVTKLIELRTEFSKIQYKYEYKEPRTLPDKKITYLTSTKQVTIDDETLNRIVEIVMSIRNEIVS